MYSTSYWFITSVRFVPNVLTYSSLSYAQLEKPTSSRFPLLEDFLCFRSFALSFVCALLLFLLFASFRSFCCLRSFALSFAFVYVFISSSRAKLPGFRFVFLMMYICRDRCIPPCTILVMFTGWKLCDTTLAHTFMFDGWDLQVCYTALGHHVITANIGSSWSNGKYKI